MRTKILIVAALMSGGISTGLLANTVPAEFPPQGYNGSQYVDSRGCVFVRAGIDGAVTWVPRVTRDRAQVCGFQPSVASEPSEEVLAEAPTDAENITVEPVETAEAAAPAPTPTAAPRKPRRAAKPAPMRTVASTMVAPKPAPRHQPVLKGPDASEGFAPSTRVVPRHVYEANQNTKVTIVPKGYKLAWQDDRLNTRRAEGTIEGYSKTRRLWTNTVPRQLIRNGTTAASTQTYHAPVAAPTPQAKQVVTIKRISTKSAAPAGRYVQVGSFGVTTNARATAQRLKQAGFPVRIARSTQGAKTMNIVLAGPFQTAAQAAQALKAARAAGFKDAFVR